MSSFEQSCIRFDTENGQFTVEDLWIMSLNDLQKISKNIRSELHTAFESLHIKNLELQFRMITHIIDSKNTAFGICVSNLERVLHETHILASLENNNQNI